MSATKIRKQKVATHRPAVRKRRFRHDDHTALDLFSGFGGLTEGVKRAGFTTIMAANHNEYKVEVHEANHPEVEHWIADLANPEASDYHSARDLPPADLLVAGVSCVNHSPANTKKAYQLGLSLFDMEDPDYDDRVTQSERDRATANCVLHYAAANHPLMILIECTTELQSWGRLIPGSKKIGDGSTYRWWLKQFEILGYKRRVLFFNAMFFGVDQSRNRGFWVFWDEKLPTPDLEHRPESWCGKCDRIVEATWTWRTGVIPPTGKVAWGEQYDYRCPSCRSVVIPPMGISLNSLDLTNLGTRIGDKPLKKVKGPNPGETVMSPMALSTMARAERCRQKFAEFPAVIMPAKAIRGSERHPWQPMATQTGQQEAALLSTGALVKAAGNTWEAPGSTCRTRGFDEPLWSQTATAETALLTPPIALAVDNYQGAPRGAGDPLPTQGGSETMAIVSAGVLPFRKNTIPTSHAQPMPTITSDQIPGLLTAAGMVKCNGSIEEAKYRAHPLSKPLGTVVGSAITQGLLFSGWYKQNGSKATDTAPHPVLDPFGTFTGTDTTALLSLEWKHALSELALEDCYFRMLMAHEIGRGCGFDVDFADYKGSFIVWGPDRAQVNGYGNAVPPQIGHFIGGRMRTVLHGAAA